TFYPDRRAPLCTRRTRPPTSRVGDPSFSRADVNVLPTLADRRAPHCTRRTRPPTPRVGDPSFSRADVNVLPTLADRRAPQIMTADRGMWITSGWWRDLT